MKIVRSAVERSGVFVFSGGETPPLQPIIFYYRRGGVFPPAVFPWCRAMQNAEFGCGQHKFVGTGVPDGPIRLKFRIFKL